MNGTDDSEPFRALPPTALLIQYVPAMPVARPGLALGLDELERVACGCPIVQCAVLEIQIERASVRRGRGTLRCRERFGRHLEAADHAGLPVAGHGAKVGVAFGRFERDAGGGPLVENLRTLDPELFQHDVVHHRFAVDHRDANRLARAGPQRRVAHAVDLASDAAIPQHRRLQDVFAIDGAGRLSGLADKVGAHAGEENGRHMGGDTGATHDVSDLSRQRYVLASCAPCAWIFRIAAAM